MADSEQALRRAIATSSLFGGLGRRFGSLLERGKCGCADADPFVDEGLVVDVGVAAEAAVSVAEARAGLIGVAIVGADVAVTGPVDIRNLLQS